MKKPILRGFSLLLLFSVCSGLLSVNDEFEAIATKSLPGQPKVVRIIKIVSEIPDFAKASDEQKKEWDALAGKINEITKKAVAKEEELKKHPIMVKLKQVRKEYFAKSGELDKKIENEIKDDPKVKELRAKIEALRKEREPVEKKGRSFEEKVKPLENKLREIESKAYEKEFGSKNAWWDMTPAQTTALEDKVKKTREYQELENQLKPLKEQEKKVSEMFWSMLNKVHPLDESIDEIKNKMKLSEKFNALNEEVEKLRGEFQELNKKSWDLQKDSMDDALSAFEPMIQLRKLFEQMKK